MCQSSEFQLQEQRDEEERKSEEERKRCALMGDSPWGSSMGHNIPQRYTQKWKGLHWLHILDRFYPDMTIHMDRFTGNSHSLRGETCFVQLWFRWLLNAQHLVVGSRFGWQWDAVWKSSGATNWRRWSLKWRTCICRSHEGVMFHCKATRYFSWLSLLTNCLVMSSFQCIQALLQHVIWMFLSTLSWLLNQTQLFGCGVMKAWEQCDMLLRSHLLLPQSLSCELIWCDISLCLCLARFLSVLSLLSLLFLLLSFSFSLPYPPLISLSHSLSYPHPPSLSVFNNSSIQWSVRRWQFGESGRAQRESTEGEHRLTE